MLTRRAFNTALLSTALASLSAPIQAAQTPDAKARLYLNRLTFGVRHQDIEAFKKRGLERWLDDQLALPVSDKDLDQRLAKSGFLIEYEDGETGQGATWTALSEMRPYTYLEADAKDLLDFLDFDKGIAWEERVRPAKEVISASLIRAVHAKAQLREVLTQFWHEHFSVNALKDETTAIFFPAYDRLMRDHAMGNFRQLLEATAKSPAMLTYLNNDASRASPANENYARELLELHTLGAIHYYNDLYDDWKAVPGARDGHAEGYIDQDVYEVARAFTGWSIGDGRYVVEGEFAPKSGAFAYFEAWHDPYQKRILGLEFVPNAAKLSDGEKVLDLLAAHPATARFVTGKLIVRLGVETPSEAYQEEIASIFHDAVDAPDQIAQTVRAIVHHTEFASTPPTKLKRPFEFLAGLYRASGGQANSPRYEVHWWLSRAGWTQHRVRPPTGHSDASADWANTRSLNGMVDLALYAHDDWFDVVEMDMGLPPEGAQTWGDLAQAWVDRLGAQPDVIPAVLEEIGAAADETLPDDPEYIAWGNRTAITLSALSPGGLFR